MLLPEGDWDSATKKFITFTRIMGKRERLYDDDNLIGGLKPVRDALVDVGIIDNDNAASAEFIYRQVRGSAGPILEIDVCELNKAGRKVSLVPTAINPGEP
jgi:hypothetical protein